MNYQNVFVVQCLSSNCFLSQFEGDMNYSPLISEACQFSDYENAFASADYMLSERFVIFSFYVKQNFH